MNKTFLTLLALVLTVSLSGQTVFNAAISNQIGDGANWTNGLPTAGNPGTLNIDANWGPGSAGTLEGYLVTQTGGVLSNSNNRNISGGTVWTINGVGAGIDLTGTAQMIHGSGSAATLNLNEGFVSTGGNLQTRNGADFNISGGTVSVGGQFNIQTNSSVLLTGGAVTIAGANGLAMQAGSLTFGVGNGTLTAGTLSTTGDSVIDFLPGSGGSITIAAFGASEFEGLWDAGNLRFDSANAGTFASSFIVTGSTLTVIPEPSAYAVLFGLGVLGLALLRRRRKA